MSLLQKIGIIAVFVFSFIFSSWYVAHGDITFSADIARDFHLLREVNEKKIVLIGPRSSTGLFHGPLWTYVDWPAYIIGHGNPIVVGWYWVLLSGLFVVSCYFIGKELFGRLSGLFFAMFTAVYMGYHTMGLFNPHGAMFFIPAFFYFFIKYMRTRKWKFLVFVLVTEAIILQFQLALGIPFIILSTLWIVVSIIKKGNKKHLLFFLLIPLMFTNFVLFDVRHDFLLAKKVASFVSPQDQGQIYNYTSLVKNRIDMAFNGTEILRHDAYGYLNVILFLSVLFLIYLQIRAGKNKDIYIYFLYFYFGFFITSFIDKGPILYFYIFPLFPLVFLIISSFLNSKYEKYLIIPLCMILLVNISNGIRDMKDSVNIIGKDTHSWKFLKEATDKIYARNDKDIGYFVYSPDSFAYEGRYAMIYAAETHHNGSYFTKKPITYLLIAPTPVNKYITGDAWWTKNQIKISSKPVLTINFPNGYKIEKYKLTNEETKIPYNTDSDPGLKFR
ncbi:MAG TPA: hypothetical protein VG917_05880 [Patescibacteria group bacterium]|nr:hypothetical protein [Patescibacteria group bacterium]